MSSSIRGNQVLSGTWGEIWVDGEPILECKKIEVKPQVQREDVQFGIDIDSKMTGIKVDITITVNQVYTRYNSIMKNYTSGKDVRAQIITKLNDPDAVGGQMERYSIDNVWWNDIPLILFEKGALIEKELTGGCTASDIVNLDEIKVK